MRCTGIAHSTLRIRVIQLEISISQLSDWNIDQIKRLFPEAEISEIRSWLRDTRQMETMLLPVLNVLSICAACK